MVLGIISIPLGSSLVFGILGLVFSIMGEKRTPAGAENNYAKTGKVCSIIGLSLGILIWVLVIVLYIGLFAALFANIRSTGGSSSLY